MTFGPVTVNRPGASATVGIMGPIGKTGTPGKDGAPGPQGPAVFTPLTAWASGTTYSPATATSAASFVSIGGSSYTCTTLHTAGIFTTDLAAGLWEPVGSKGDKGDPGTPGSVWYEGAGAPAAAVGLNGDYFLRTDTYDVLIKVSGAWTVIGNLKGLAGNTIQNGTGAPANTLGVNGDFYLDTTSGAPRLYGPKASGAWPASSISLIGSGAGSVNPTGSYTVGDILVAATSDGKTLQDSGFALAALLAKAGGQVTGALDLAPAATVASAATTAIGAAASNFVQVTGTTAITAFDTVNESVYRFVRFASAGLVLTHDATKLALPGAASITTQAGDHAIFRSLGAGNWRCISYQRADGTAVTSPTLASLGGLTRSQVVAASYGDPCNAF